MKSKVTITQKMLATYMFPFTPLELHEGYVIGTERIVTKTSGLFGWGDSSQHAVRVFNDKGEEVPDFKAPLVRHWFKAYTELRIPEGWNAVIVRREKKEGVTLVTKRNRQTCHSF